jgi:Glycosyltransferase family 87
VTRRPLLLALLLVILALPAAAHAATPEGVGPPVSALPPATERPPGFATNEREAVALADATRAAQAVHRTHPHAQIEALVWGGSHWEIDYSSGARVLLEVDVDRAGRVVHVFTGIRARSYIAQSRFGGLFDSPWVFLPFALLFLAPFFDPRRPFRLLHIDLIALLSFGVSYWLFSRGHTNAGVVAVYPVLGYLLLRLVLAAVRPRRPAGRLVPLAPTALLAVGLVVLVGARVGLNLASHKVEDVGYASVVGADRIEHGQPLYVDDDAHGDTYGPVAYMAYVPFELAFPWHGSWDYLPSAHAATLAFDLLTLLGLFMLGRRMRAGAGGIRLGLAFAWAWAAFPFTLLGVILNVNDGLVALLAVFALVAYTRSGLGRATLIGLGAAAKFLPGALLPLMASGRDTSGRRRALGMVLAGSAVFLLAFAPFIPDGGVREIWNCTLGYQLGRFPTISIWGVYLGLGWLQKAAWAAALLFALVVAFAPRERSFTQLCCLAGAVTIALQIPSGHWFWFYIVWFMPFVLVGLLGAYGERREGLRQVLSKECGLTWPAADASPRRRGAVGAGAGFSTVSSFLAFRSSSSRSST